MTELESQLSQRTPGSDLVISYRQTCGSVSLLFSFGSLVTPTAACVFTPGVQPLKVQHVSTGRSVIQVIFCNNVQYILGLQQQRRLYGACTVR